MELIGDPICPLIESFFERITEEQLNLLKSGTPDDGTKILLAELVLGMIMSLTKGVLAALMSRNLTESEDDIQSRLDDILPQISSQVLGIPDKVDSVSSRKLSDLIVQEVRENITSALSGNSPTVQTLIDQRLIPPQRLNTMVSHAYKTVKDVMAKMKSLFSCQRQKRRNDLIQEEVEARSDPPKDQEMSSFVDDSQLLDGPEEKETPEEISSVTSRKSKASESLQEEIRKELIEIISPLLNDLTDAEYEKLKSEICQELKVLSDEISDFICLKGNNKGPPKVVRDKIKRFITKCLVKVWIHRLLEQLKTKHQKHSNIESGALVESLVESIISQLQIDNAEEGDDGDEDSKMKLFNSSSADDLLAFTTELSNVIACHFQPETVPELLKMAQVQGTAVPELQAEMSADIQSKVWIFAVLMNWWTTTQMNGLSERMNLPILDDMLLSDAAEMAAPEIEETPGNQDPELRMKQNKTLVRVLIDKVLWLVYCDAKLVPENRCDITNHMFENVWDGVKEAKLYITPDNLKNLSKNIYKDLCKMWGNEHHVLCFLNLKDPTTDASFVSIFRSHLTTSPRQPSAIRGFFSRPRRR